MIDNRPGLLPHPCGAPACEAGGEPTSSQSACRGLKSPSGPTKPAGAGWAAAGPPPQFAGADLVALELDLNPGAGSETLLAELREERERLRANLAALEARIRQVGQRICPLCAGTGRRRVRSGLYPAFELWICDCPFGRAQHSAHGEREIALFRDFAFSIRPPRRTNA